MIQYQIPQKKDDDPLDKVMKGLAIANTVYGMGADISRLQAMKEEQNEQRMQREEAAERERELFKAQQGKIAHEEGERSRQNGPLSAEETAQYRRFGISIPEGASRKQVNEQYGPLGDYVKAQMIKKASGGSANSTPSTDENRKTAQGLRQERNNLPVTKETQVVATAYNKIRKAAAQPSAAGDLSLIFGYMKMQDPGSTVREGEQATAQNAAGIPEQLRNLYNRARTGQRLAPEQRDDFISQAKNIYDSQIAQQNQVDSGYMELAKKYSLDPKEIIFDYSAQPERPKAPPRTNAQAPAGNPFQNTANAAPKNQTPVSKQELEGLSDAELLRLHQQVKGKP